MATAQTIAVDARKSAANSNRNTVPQVGLSPHYLSSAEIRAFATVQLELLIETMACYKIPAPYKREWKTDEATTELRTAIEEYVARMQDEREPYRD